MAIGHLARLQGSSCRARGSCQDGRVGKEVGKRGKAARRGRQEDAA